MSQRNRACGGIDVPAKHLSRASIIFLKSFSESLPRPTSTNVPTTALTMFRRNLSARMVNTMPGTPYWLFQSSHRASRRSQILVLASECSFANDVKSSVSLSKAAARFIASVSRAEGECQDTGERKGDLPKLTKYRYSLSVASNLACASSEIGRAHV